jgi:cytochrome b subunit of formate dehydrogenase
MMDVQIVSMVLRFTVQSTPRRSSLDRVSAVSQEEFCGMSRKRAGRYDSEMQRLRWKFSACAFIMDVSGNLVVSWRRKLYVTAVRVFKLPCPFIAPLGIITPGMIS